MYDGKKFPKTGEGLKDTDYWDQEFDINAILPKKERLFSNLQSYSSPEELEEAKQALADQLQEYQKPQSYTDETLLNLIGLKNNIKDLKTLVEADENLEKRQEIIDELETYLQQCEELFNTVKEARKEQTLLLEAQKEFSEQALELPALEAFHNTCSKHKKHSEQGIITVAAFYFEELTELYNTLSDEINEPEVLLEINEAYLNAIKTELERPNTDTSSSEPENNLEDKQQACLEKIEALKETIKILRVIDPTIDDLESIFKAVLKGTEQTRRLDLKQQIAENVAPFIDSEEGLKQGLRANDFFAEHGLGDCLEAATTTEALLEFLDKALLEASLPLPEQGTSDEDLKPYINRALDRLDIYQEQTPDIYTKDLVNKLVALEVHIGNLKNRVSNEDILKELTEVEKQCKTLKEKVKAALTTQDDSDITPVTESTESTDQKIISSGSSKKTVPVQSFSDKESSGNDVLNNFSQNLSEEESTAPSRPKYLEDYVTSLTEISKQLGKLEQKTKELDAKASSLLTYEGRERYSDTLDEYHKTAKHLKVLLENQANRFENVKSTFHEKHKWQSGSNVSSRRNANSPQQLPKEIIDLEASIESKISEKNSINKLEKIEKQCGEQLAKQQPEIDNSTRKRVAPEPDQTENETVDPNEHMAVRTLQAAVNAYLSADPDQSELSQRNFNALQQTYKKLYETIPDHETELLMQINELYSKAINNEIDRLWLESENETTDTHESVIRSLKNKLKDIQSQNIHHYRVTESFKNIKSLIEDFLKNPNLNNPDTFRAQLYIPKVVLCDSDNEYKILKTKLLKDSFFQELHLNDFINKNDNLFDALYRLVSIIAIDSVINEVVEKLEGLFTPFIKDAHTFSNVKVEELKKKIGVYTHGANVILGGPIRLKEKLLENVFFTKNDLKGCFRGPHRLLEDALNSLVDKIVEERTNATLNVQSEPNKDLSDITEDNTSSEKNISESGISNNITKIDIENEFEDQGKPDSDMGVNILETALKTYLQTVTEDAETKYTVLAGADTDSVFMKNLQDQAASISTATIAFVLTKPTFEQVPEGYDPEKSGPHILTVIIPANQTDKVIVIEPYGKGEGDSEGVSYLTKLLDQNCLPTAKYNTINVQGDTRSCGRIAFATAMAFINNAYDPDNLTANELASAAVLELHKTFDSEPRPLSTEPNEEYSPISVRDDYTLLENYSQLILFFAACANCKNEAREVSKSAQRILDKTQEIKETTTYLRDNPDLEDQLLNELKDEINQLKSIRKDNEDEKQQSADSTLHYFSFLQTAHEELCVSIQDNQTDLSQSIFNALKQTYEALCETIPEHETELLLNIHELYREALTTEKIMREPPVSRILSPDISEIILYEKDCNQHIDTCEKINAVFEKLVDDLSLFIKNEKVQSKIDKPLKNIIKNQMETIASIENVNGEEILKNKLLRSPLFIDNEWVTYFQEPDLETALKNIVKSILNNKVNLTLSEAEPEKNIVELDEVGYGDDFLDSEESIEVSNLSSSDSFESIDEHGSDDDSKKKQELKNIETAANKIPEALRLKFREFKGADDFDSLNSYLESVHQAIQEIVSKATTPEAVEKVLRLLSDDDFQEFPGTPVQFKNACKNLKINEIKTSDQLAKLLIEEAKELIYEQMQKEGLPKKLNQLSEEIEQVTAIGKASDLRNKLETVREFLENSILESELSLDSLNAGSDAMLELNKLQKHLEIRTNTIARLDEVFERLDKEESNGPEDFYPKIAELTKDLNEEELNVFVDNFNEKKPSEMNSLSSEKLKKYHDDTTPLSSYFDSDRNPQNKPQPYKYEEVEPSSTIEPIFTNSSSLKQNNDATTSSNRHKKIDLDDALVEGSNRKRDTNKIYNTNPTSSDFDFSSSSDNNVSSGHDSQDSSQHKQNTTEKPVDTNEVSLTEDKLKVETTPTQSPVENDNKKKALTDTLSKFCFVHSFRTKTEDQAKATVYKATDDIEIKFEKITPDGLKELTKNLQLFSEKHNITLSAKYDSAKASFSISIPTDQPLAKAQLTGTPEEISKQIMDQKMQATFEMMLTFFKNKQPDSKIIISGKNPVLVALAKIIAEDLNDKMQKSAPSPIHLDPSAKKANPEEITKAKDFYNKLKPKAEIIDDGKQLKLNEEKWSDFSVHKAPGM